MNKKIGRNDPCPCGSGKKYKKCCEDRLGPKRKFQASVLSAGMSGGEGLRGKASKISTDFFSKTEVPKEAPKMPKVDGANHPPEADKPM